MTQNGCRKRYLRIGRAKSEGCIFTASQEDGMKAPNPMVTIFKTLDVSPLVKMSKGKNFKFTMLLDYCIGKSASVIKGFYTLPVGNKLIQYETIAVNTIVKTKNGEVSSCECDPFRRINKQRARAAISLTSCNNNLFFEK